MLRDMLQLDPRGFVCKEPLHSLWPRSDAGILVLAEPLPVFQPGKQVLAKERA